MPAAPPVSVEDAKLVLGQTAVLDETICAFEGGAHTFVLSEEMVDGVARTRVLLDLDGAEYNVGVEGYLSALKKLPGGGEAMAGKWPLRMVMEPLNYFFDHRPGDFKMLSQGDEVLCFTKAKSVLFDPVDVLDTMVAAVGRHGGKNKVVVENLVHSLEETMFTVRPPDDHVSFVEAMPGDRTLGGLAFTGSLLGYRDATVELFSHRIVCRNGMISPDGASHFRISDADDADGENDIERMDEWLATQCAELFEGEPITREFARIRHLRDHKVTLAETGRVLNDLRERFHLTSDVGAEIDEALGTEGDKTMYGIVQAMTRAAQHAPDLTDAQRYRLMRDAGAATMDMQTICDACRRPLR